MDRVPIKDKYLLTITQSADYFGIGEHTIRSIVSENPNADYLVTNGNRTLIKRKKFEDYLDKATVI